MHPQGETYQPKIMALALYDPLMFTIEKLAN